MIKYKSPIYENCFLPETFEELIRLISATELDEWEEPFEFVPVRFWRGQGNIEWKIDSGAFRRIQLGYKTSNYENENLIFYERRLLNHATHKGFKFHEGREISDFELLAKLQHHGAATRLVDFSRNALIGLWFCCNSQKDKTGILIGVHSHYVGGSENSNINKQYEIQIKGIQDSEHPQVYESPSVSSRISSQHGQFLYSGVSNNKYGSLQLPREPEGKLFIAITPQNKSRFLDILESVFDFRSQTLFPDLDGFGMANHFLIEPNKMSRW